MPKQKTIDLSDYIRDVRGMYKEDLAQGTFNALVLGEMGSGKTHSLLTARQPILLHSFDPGGSKLRPMKQAQKEGWLVADTRYESDNPSNPHAFSLWEKEFEKLFNSNAFEHFGTYCIDSFTTWVNAIKHQILKNQGRKDGIMAQHDWQVLKNTVEDSINVMTGLPCDVILTGHLTTEKDDVTGRIKAILQSIPSLQTSLPILFDEIYVIESNETSKGIERKFITANTGKYQARTRVGSGVFELREDPNYKKLLKKAGMTVEDKPSLDKLEK